MPMTQRDLANIIGINKESEKWLLNAGNLSLA